MKPFELVNASSLASALGHLAQQSGAVAKAGGVDLVDLMKEGVTTPPRVINLRTITGLDAVASDDKGARLGPLITLAKLATAKGIADSPHYRALAQAAAAAATPQIRAMATLGGNLCQRPRCWYFRNAEYACLRKGGSRCFAHNGDNAYHAVFDNGACAIVHPSAAATALVALDAKLELSSSKAKRTVAASDFFVSSSKDVRRENNLKPAELISSITLPAPLKNTRSTYLKVKHKQSFDWPLGEVAVCLTLDDAGKVSRARVVLGAVAPVPWRVPAAEKALIGKAIDKTVAREVATAALSGARPLTDNGYKVELVTTMVERALLV